MNINITFAIVVCLLVAMAIGQMFVKTTTRPFTDTPDTAGVLDGSVRKKAADKAETDAERQRRMIEQMKERMERNKF